MHVMKGGGGEEEEEEIFKKGIRGPPVCRSCPIVGTGWGAVREKERERERERDGPSTFSGLW